VRILLDECIDRRFAAELVGHDVSTVPQMGWAGLKNGDLRRTAETDFDVFVTVDRNLSVQQDVSAYALAVVVLRARSNRLVDLRPLAAGLLAVLGTAVKGEATFVS
jgi:hypothetical protein